MSAEQNIVILQSDSQLLRPGQGDGILHLRPGDQVGQKSVKTLGIKGRRFGGRLLAVNVGGNWVDLPGVILNTPPNFTCLVQGSITAVEQSTTEGLRSYTLNLSLIKCAGDCAKYGECPVANQLVRKQIPALLSV